MRPKDQNKKIAFSHKKNKTDKNLRIETIAHKKHWVITV